MAAAEAPPGGACIGVRGRASPTRLAFPRRAGEGAGGRPFGRRGAEKKRWRRATRPAWGGRLALHGAGQAGDVVLDEEGVDEGHRHRAQQRARHELPPEVDVAADELGDYAHRYRLALRGGQEDERVNELVPGQRESEDTGGEDTGDGDGEDDAGHGPEPGG